MRDLFNSTGAPFLAPDRGGSFGLPQAELVELKGVSSAGGPVGVVSRQIGKPLVVWPDTHSFGRGVDFEYETQLLRAAKSAITDFFRASMNPDRSIWCQSCIMARLTQAGKYIGGDQGLNVRQAVLASFDELAKKRELKNCSVESVLDSGRELDTMAQDAPSYQAFALIALDRLRKRFPFGGESPVPAKIRAEELFDDYFLLRKNESGVILASPALPPFVMDFFGDEFVSGILLPTAAHARISHLLNRVSVDQIPLVVSTLGQAGNDDGWAKAARDLFGGKHGIVSVGPASKEGTPCSLILSHNGRMLEKHRREIDSSLKGTIIEQDRIFTARNAPSTEMRNEFFLSLEVSSRAEARSFRGPEGKGLVHTGVGLVKTEFLLDELLRSLKIEIGALTDKQLRQVHRELIQDLTEKGVEQITLRSVDFALDKLPPPKGWTTENFTEFVRRQIRAIAGTVQELDKANKAPDALFLMIPELRSEKHYHLVRRQLSAALTSAGLPPDRIGVVPMVETGRAIPVLKHLFQQGVPISRVAVGMADFSRDMTHLLRGDQELLIPPPVVVAGLREIRRITDAAQADLILCGDVLRPAFILPIFEGLGIRSLAVRAGYYNGLAERIPALEHEKAEACLAEWDLLTSFKERAQRLREYWRSTGLSKPEIDDLFEALTAPSGPTTTAGRRKA